MPTILDPRKITLTKQTRIIYSNMIEVENAFCDSIGEVGFQHKENRQKLIFAHDKIDLRRARSNLKKLESVRADYLNSAKEDEVTSRETRTDVGFFDTIADQSTLPPRLVCRAGLRDITAENLADVLEELKDKADFVKLQQVRAYRVGVLTLQEAMEEVNRQILLKQEHIDRSRHHGNHARARLQEQVLTNAQEVFVQLRALAARSDADALHVRLRSGTGSRFRARFPGVGSEKWFTVPFTIANIAVVGVVDKDMRNVSPRSREREYERIAVCGLFEVFEPRKPSK